MARHRKQTDEEKVPELVRKSLLLDAAKLEMARKAIGAISDSEVIRVALDHLLGHFSGAHDEEG
jgi:hypothetical protein